MENKKTSIGILIFLALSLVIGSYGILQKTPDVEARDSGIKRITEAIVKSKRPGIGYIRISGPIHMGVGISPLFQDFNSSEVISSLIYKALDNPKIRALLIRINSPGGTVAATQEIYNAIMYVRQKGLFTVASMGDIAASGGYYIASACDTIFASPGSLTGSIGVIISSINLKKFLDRFGISYQTFKSGKYKDILSPAREVTKEEYKMIQKLVDSTYMQFVDDVARGRKFTEKKVKSFADGRIFNGVQAKKIGLIDKLGDFHKALLYAHKKAKLKGVKPHLIPLTGSPWESFLNQLSNSSPTFLQSILQILTFSLNRSINFVDNVHGMKSIYRNQGTILKRNEADGFIQYKYLP